MMTMHKKKVGIIGGMGSRAGVKLLQLIIDYSPAITDQEFPEILYHNNSAIPDRTRAIIHGGPSPLEGIYRSLEMFNSQQVEVVAIACVTSHYYYDSIADYSKSKVLNPLQLLADRLMHEYTAVKRVGVLATTGSIKSGLYQQALEKCNVEVVTLDPVSQEEIFMRAVYMKNGFKSACISDEARELMQLSMKKMKALNVDMIIGGCTEVSLGVMPENEMVPYLDVLDLLARRTVECCYDLD
ncbi:aspartate racemase [Chitinophaga dinghuensis]|uniref:Aspartate racemase n=1 Tax=Chitinophaga dinghuensis TaxID=1539050 RepID=A0A327VT88_9BACT|nr:amino acid racemase [Chitinophaga dinghuensis]RAJ77624.1 aspartate racemase [Chitinophaga dinghuensis]